MMELLPKELADKLPKLYEQDGEKEQTVHLKFFDPCSQWTWFVLEYDPVDQIFFGLVRGHEIELGYFTLKELQDYKGPLKIGIERDIWFKPRLLSEVKQSLGAHFDL